MNRYQAYGSSAEIIDRLAYARGFVETFNADIIFNLPGQTAQSLQYDLKMLKQLEIPQISWYPLIPSIDHQGDRDCVPLAVTEKDQSFTSIRQSVMR
jgi:coproporphyrinogen III oxidase-like Fe-S oxidoreductase